MALAAPSAQFLDKLIGKILDAARGATQLDTSNGDAVGMYVFAILAMAAGFLPIGGSAVSSLIGLIGTVLFSGPTEKTWQLMDRKIDEYHARVLKRKIAGFRNTYSYYIQCQQNYEQANSFDEKRASRDTLRSAHVNFQMLMHADITAFQQEGQTVASLPLFVLAATMHLMLLVDGMHKGLEWGYSKANVEQIAANYHFYTTLHNKPALWTRSSGLNSSTSYTYADLSWNSTALPLSAASPLPSALVLSALDRSRNSSADAQAPKEVLASWKAAYTALYETGLAANGNAPNIANGRQSYADYVDETYRKGRAQVTWEDHWYDFKRTVDGRRSRAFSEYDTRMVVGALNIAELWPFLAGAESTEEAQRNVDREVFFGPYGDYAEAATWSASAPAPVEDWEPPIDAIRVARTYNEIAEYSVRKAGNWTYIDGRTGDSIYETQSIELHPGENFTSFSVGFFTSLILFRVTTSSDAVLAIQGAWNNNGHMSFSKTFQPPFGYQLSSIRRSRPHGSDGFAGLILGFRPIH